MIIFSFTYSYTDTYYTYLLKSIVSTMYLQGAASRCNRHRGSK